MGTRSFVGTFDADATADGEFHARLVHWDGYRAHMEEALTEIVGRDGAAKAAKVLVEDNIGWSFVGTDHGKPRQDQKVVDGYGIAYTDPDDEYLIRGRLHGPAATFGESAAEWGYLIEVGHPDDHKVNIVTLAAAPDGRPAVVGTTTVEFPFGQPVAASHG